MRSIASPHEDSRQWPGVERRKEPRTAASGEIELTIDEPKPLRFQGQLMDVSARGFQVSYFSDALRPGQEVTFSHAGGSGRARVMWTRVIPGWVSSGFFVLGST